MNKTVAEEQIGGSISELLIIDATLSGAVLTVTTKLHDGQQILHHLASLIT